MGEKQQTVRERAAEFYRSRIFRRGELASIGISGRGITRAVRRGLLIRIRRDRYALPAIEQEIIQAVQCGGRLSCLSLLKMVGVFVQSCDRLHVQVPPGTSRTTKPDPKHVERHWTAWSEDPGCLHAASVADAVGQAVRCQTPRAAIATLDSVLHHRLMTWEQLNALFAELPERLQVLLALVDPSAESGPETYVRLILRALGLAFERQVFIPGVGRVDFVVEGWLIIECDSREFHQGWDKQVEDRRRDLAAAKSGYITIRPVATDIMSREADVRRDIAAVVEALRPRFASVGAHNSSKNRR